MIKAHHRLCLFCFSSLFSWKSGSSLARAECVKQHEWSMCTPALRAATSQRDDAAELQQQHLGAAEATESISPESLRVFTAQRALKSSDIYKIH